MATGTHDCGSLTKVSQSISRLMRFPPSTACTYMSNIHRCTIAIIRKLRRSFLCCLFPEQSYRAIHQWIRNHIVFLQQTYNPLPFTSAGSGSAAKQGIARFTSSGTTSRNMGRPPSGAFLYRLRESGMDVLYGNGREFSHSIVLEDLYHYILFSSILLLYSCCEQNLLCYGQCFRRRSTSRIVRKWRFLRKMALGSHYP